MRARAEGDRAKGEIAGSRDCQVRVVGIGQVRQREERSTRGDGGGGAASSGQVKGLASGDVQSHGAAGLQSDAAELDVASARAIRIGIDGERIAGDDIAADGDLIVGVERDGAGGVERTGDGDGVRRVDGEAARTGGKCAGDSNVTVGRPEVESARATESKVSININVAVPGSNIKVDAGGKGAGVAPERDRRIIAARIEEQRAGDVGRTGGGKSVDRDGCRAGIAKSDIRSGNRAEFGGRDIKILIGVTKADAASVRTGDGDVAFAGIDGAGTGDSEISGGNTDVAVTAGSIQQSARTGKRQRAGAIGFVIGTDGDSRIGITGSDGCSNIDITVGGQADNAECVRGHCGIDIEVTSSEQSDVSIIAGSNSIRGSQVCACSYIHVPARSDAGDAVHVTHGNGAGIDEGECSTGVGRDGGNGVVLNEGDIFPRAERRIGCLQGSASLRDKAFATRIAIGSEDSCEVATRGRNRSTGVEDVVIRPEGKRPASRTERNIGGNGQVLASGQFKIAGKRGGVQGREATGGRDISATNCGQGIVASDTAVQDGEVQVAGIVDEDSIGTRVPNVQVIYIGFNRIDISTGIVANTSRRIEDRVRGHDVVTIGIVINDTPTGIDGNGIVVGQGLINDKVTGSGVYVLRTSHVGTLSIIDTKRIFIGAADAIHIVTADGGRGDGSTDVDRATRAGIDFEDAVGVTGVALSNEHVVGDKRNRTSVISNNRRPRCYVQSTGNTRLRL